MKRTITAIVLIFTLVGQPLAQTGDGPYTWQAKPGYANSIQSQLNALKGAIPPVPTGLNAGQFLVVNAAGTGTAFTPISGDCVSSNTTPGRVTCTGSSGTPFGNLATANADGTTLTVSSNIASVKLVPIANGGTNATSAVVAFDNLSPLTTLGDLVYENASLVGTRLPGNTTTTKKFLTQTGNSTISAAPVWSTIIPNDISSALTDPTSIGNVTPSDGTFTILTSTNGFTATNGVPISSTGGTKPTMTCSGGSTGVSVANGSTSNRGQVTTSSSASTNCTITFDSGAHFPQTPFCQFTDANASITPVAFSADTTSVSSTKFDFASATSQIVNYQCF